MAKILSGLCAILFSALIAGSAQAGSIPPINPQQCSIPDVCNILNQFIVPPVNGQACTASGATPQTCNGTRGSVTTNSLATATLTNAVYVINNSNITATSNVGCQVAAYSGTIVTNGIPVITSCVPGAGTITVNITNTGANALAGTVTVAFTLEQN